MATYCHCRIRRNQHRYLLKTDAFWLSSMKFFDLLVSRTVNCIDPCTVYGNWISKGHSIDGDVK